MIKFPRRFATASIATLLCATATPVLADVTAKQAWNNWFEQLKDAGFEVEFDESTTGDTLSINNLVLSREMQGENTLTLIELPPIAYRERGDGTVAVLIPADALLVWVFNDALRLTFNQHMSGLSYIISGTPKAMSHDVMAKEISYSLTKTTGGAKGNDTKIDIAFGDLAISRTANSAELQSLSTDAVIGQITYDLYLDVADSPGQIITLSGGLSDLSWNGDFAIPADLEVDDFAEFIATEFAIKAGIQFGGFLGAIAVTDSEKTVKASFSLKSGSTDLKVVPNADKFLEVAQDMSLGALAFDVDVVEGPLDIDANVEMENLSGAYEFSVPDSFDPDNLAAALNAGFSFHTMLKHGPVSGMFSKLENGEKEEGNLTAESGDLFLTFNRQMMHYGGHSGSVKSSVQTKELPVGPVEYSLAGFAFDLLMPINVSSKPEDFSFQFSLVDLWINDALWGLFDPAAKLPRDPATFVMDITGAGNWLVDVMDNGLDQDNGGAPKAELHALTVNTLRLNAAGTELTGSGDFTFNNGDLTSYDGLPAPTGTMDMKLTGGNGLIDNLVEMGLLPEDQAMGLRMGLGLFTVAGDGDDTLISHIEATGDGKVLANGQRLK